MRKVIIITGLTGSGKSGLAVKIAKEFNSEYKKPMKKSFKNEQIS